MPRIRRFNCDQALTNKTRQGSTLRFSDADNSLRIIYGSASHFDVLDIPVYAAIRAMARLRGDIRQTN